MVVIDPVGLKVPLLGRVGAGVRRIEGLGVEASLGLGVSTELPDEADGIADLKGR
jgi:hypothetical protein